MCAIISTQKTTMGMQPTPSRVRYRQPLRLRQLPRLRQPLRLRLCHLQIKRLAPLSISKPDREHISSESWSQNGVSVNFVAHFVEFQPVSTKWNRPKAADKVARSSGW